MKEVAPLSYGVIFKKAFSDVEIFKAFVKDFLGIELEITKVETEKSLSPPIGSVDSRFDLFAEDEKHRTIVDIQHVRNPDHYNRFLHYHCAALLEQVVHSKDYNPKLNLYTIVVLTSGDRHKRDICEIDFDPKDRNGVGIGEISHKILYLCPKYATEETPEPYREWLMAINDSLDEKVEESNYHKREIKRVFELISKDKTTPQEYARMKDEYSQKERELKKYKEGVEEGIKKGIEVGAIKEKIEIAKNLLDVLDNETISLKTGLSIDKIEELRKN